MATVFNLICALSVCAVSLAAESCDTASCDGFTRSSKAGGSMIQKNVAEIQRVAQNGEPDGQYIKLSTRMSTMEARVGKLEEDSSEGREALKTQLSELTTAVDTMQSSGTGSLDDTTSRVGASEAQVNTLVDTVDSGNAALRKGVETLREEYITLAKNVGEAFASLSAMQTSVMREPAATAAPAAPVATVAPAATSAATAAPAIAAPATGVAVSTPVAAGGGLTGRATALETRVATLENASDEERTALKEQIEALDKRVDIIRAGGVGSLDHTTSRVGSAEQQLSSLQGVVDTSSADIRADLASLTANVDDLSSKVGAGALLQMTETREPAKTLPLTIRIQSLETRIAQLEEQSSRERGTLKVQLDALTEKVEDIKVGGVSSLEHTTLRQSSVETDFAALQKHAAEQKANLEAMTATLKAKLSDVRARVGASLLESASA